MSDCKAKWDALTVAELQQRGTRKWSMTCKETHRPLLGAWVAESDFGPAPVVKSALQQAIANNLTGYMPAQFIDKLRTSCARFQRERYGWDISASCVIPTSDVLSILRTMIKTFTEPGDSIIVPTPAYMPFLTIPGELSRLTVQVTCTNLNGWELNMDGIEDACKAGAKLLILCNPWNPTGRAFRYDELKAVAQLCAKYGLLVFSDEIHSPLTLPGNRHIPFASINDVAAGHTITATAASKAFNIPGLKCAQAIISNTDLAERVAALLRDNTAHLMPLGAIASIAAYDQGREWLDAECEYIANNVRYVHQAVTAAGFQIHMPEATYLTWWNVNRADGGDILEREADVLVNRGVTLGEAFANYIRFNAGTGRAVLEYMVERSLAALTAQKH